MKPRSFVVRGLTSLARFVENLTQTTEPNQPTDKSTRRSKQPAGPLQFKRKDRFFTASEQAFYTRLQEAVGSDLIIMSKVRLIDLIEPTGDEQQRFLGVAKSAQKHLDFVLLKPGTYEILAAIELDGSSHNQYKQLRRDEQKARMLESAGVPLLRFSSLEVLPAEMIRQRLTTLLPNGLSPSPAHVIPQAVKPTVTTPTEAPAQSQAESESPPAEAPVCFKCGRTMVLKRSEKGSFWACPGFPRRRNTLAVKTR